MNTGKKIGIGLLIVLLVAGGFWFFRGKKTSGNLRLDVGTVSRNTITSAVTATGTVEPVISVEVGTQVSGIIDKIYVDYNSVVTKGQLIAEMDKVNLQAELASQQATLASAKAEYDYQKSNYDRYKTLFDKQLISNTDFETATYSYDIAVSSYQRAQSDMTKVRRNLEYATITSPIDGVVINRAVEEGQTVAAGFSTPTLFTIANDLTQMQVIANVDEADIGQVEEGQNVTFTVDAYPDDTFEGRVTQVRLEATIESNVVTYEVVISAYNPDLKLKPGLTANIVIYTLERPDVLTVPSKALRFIPDTKQLSAMKIRVENPNIQAPSGKRTVWLFENGILKPQVVSTGMSSGNFTEVVDGLKEGDEVALDIEDELPMEMNGNTEVNPFAPRRPGGRR